MAAASLQQHSPSFYCSTFSQRVGEQIFGTAVRADVWLLLTYSASWGPKAFEASDLPPPVKGQIAAWLDAIPHARLQFIKQQPPPSTTGIVFYVALARDASPTLYAFQLDAYTDLLTLDVPAVVAGDPAYRDAVSEESLFLVCTNGRRDRCCAKFGLPIYTAMTQHAGRAVWQSTHLGGHRFAATAVFLPAGVCYGRIETTDVGTMLEMHRQGRIYLEKYRGRSCYDQIVQVADYFLRMETGVTDWGAFRLVDVENVAGDARLVRFISVTDGMTHHVHVAPEPATLHVYKSSGDAETSPVPQYRLVTHKVVGAQP